MKSLIPHKTQSNEAALLARLGSQQLGLKVLRLVAVTFVIIVTLTACSEPEPVATRLPHAKVVALSSLLMPYQYTTPAKAISVNDSHISAETSGTVAKIVIDVGEQAKAGQALIELDCLDTRNQYQEAKASLNSLEAREVLAVQRFERAKRLRAQRSIAEEDLNLRQSEQQSAIADRKAQTARVAIAKRNVEHCIIKAPFDGVVTERNVQLGEMVNAGSNVLRFVDNINLEVTAEIVTEDVASLNTAAQINFEYKGVKHPLRLRAVAGVVDSRTRTQEARLRFNAQKPIPGSAGRLSWQAQQPALPTHYISRRNGQLGILLAEGDVTRFHALPDAQEGQPAFVDLPADTDIITEGRLGLSIGEQFIRVE